MFQYKDLQLILYSNSRYYETESCRLEWIDYHPSLHHLKFSGNCLVIRLSFRQCQWSHDMAAKCLSYLRTVYLLRHCPTNDAILYILSELFSRVIQSIQTSGNHSGIEITQCVKDTWCISNGNVL